MNGRVLRTLAVVIAGLVATGAEPGAATAGGGVVHEDLRLIAMPRSATGPSPAGLRIDASGRDLIVGEDGPHVWRWRHGIAGTSPHPEDVDPLGCGDLEGGLDDVAVTRAPEFYAVNDCIPAAAGEFEWSSSGTAWNAGQSGMGRVIDVDNDGGWISTDDHDPGRLYFVSHTLAGPGLVGGGVIVRRSADGGRSWSEPAYVNAPTNYPSAQRAEAAVLNGPDLYTTVVVDPKNARHLTIAWTAESNVDDAQDHADDYIDHYEWDTSAHVASSYDGGRTWSARIVLNTGQHPVGTSHSAYNDIAGWQPSLVSGSGRTLYLGFTEMFAHTSVWQPRVMRSLDGGRSWSRPVDLPHRGSAFASTLAVWRGQLVTGWFASTTKDAGDPKSRWSLRLARYRWSRVGSPHLVASAHTSVVHVGDEQPIGTGQDPLHDTLDLAVDHGRVLTPIAVGDGARARPYLVVWRQSGA